MRAHILQTCAHVQIKRENTTYDGKISWKKENFKRETHMKWTEDFLDADSLSISFPDRYKTIMEISTIFSSRNEKNILLQLNEINSLSTYHICVCRQTSVEAFDMSIRF